jgi:hypothetical protein
MARIFLMRAMSLALRLEAEHPKAMPGYLSILTRAVSSVGRAPRLHRGGREFEPLTAHHKKPLFGLSLLDLDATLN